MPTFIHTFNVVGSFSRRICVNWSSGKAVSICVSVCRFYLARDRPQRVSPDRSKSNTWSSRYTGYLVIATSLITTADVSLEVNRFLICKKLFRTTLIRDRRRTVDSPELEPILPQRKSLDFSCDFYRNFNSPSIIRTLFVNNRRSKS